MAAPNKSVVRTEELGEHLNGKSFAEIAAVLMNVPVTEGGGLDGEKSEVSDKDPPSPNNDAIPAAITPMLPTHRSASIMTAHRLPIVFEQSDVNLGRLLFIAVLSVAVVAALFGVLYETERQGNLVSPPIDLRLDVS